MDIRELLTITKERDASDLHLTVGIPPIIRINGKLKKLNLPELTLQDVHEMIYSIITDQQKSNFEQFHELDFSFELENGARFKTNIFRTRRGEAAAFRLIPEKIKSLTGLNLPEEISIFTKKTKGFVLVTGPAGSGKTTTLATLIDIINRERYEHIITIEDPIEFIHTHKNCIIDQREVGTHTNSFAGALRSALREDPDVILVGEMRDLETISMAVTAAETGHLVFSTLHTNSAAETVERIINVFPPHQQSQIRMQVAESLVGIIAQTLIPTIDEGGRVPAIELMIATTAIRNIIREEKIHQMPATIQMGRKDGMLSLDQSLKNLLIDGKISQEEAIKRAIDKKAFMHVQSRF
ncbi:MAG: type IV pilus twitching motility protein PilT [Atribacteria sp.]|nr:type IV pilus twitching motility protein PilT [Candidatus Atribacteria bacterium]MBU4047740.1 type IV pilus twitching motility protein PilT [bacterium]